MYEYSKYQKAIFDFIQTGIGNAVVNAKAGSGKTTTMVEAAKLISQNENVLFVAFNKAIEQELTERLTGYDNILVKTFHSLGFSILKENIGFCADININEYKYIGFINKHLHEIAPNSSFLNKNDLKIYKSNIKQLVDFARYNLAQSPDEIEKLCDKYGIDVISDECEVVPVILDWGKSVVSEIDYTDMVWMCIERDFITRRLLFDYIFIDEAQDSSIMQQALIKKCFKRGTRFIAIGDEFQCINAFAGADQDAFKKFIQEPNTTQLDLSISYRCPKKIIQLAREATGADIEAKDDAIEGEIRRDVNPYEPQNGDMVLCRNTAHLVKLYMKYNAVNKKSYIKGRSIGEVFKSYVIETGQPHLSWDMTCDGVFPRLYERLFNMIEREMEQNCLEYEEAIKTHKIVDMIDSIKALEVLAEGLTWTEDLLKKIDIIFTDNDGEGVCLSTVHKAKGLESDNVYILCESLMPSKYATKKWQIIAEENLIYVAITRAKKTLNYISEKSFPANLYGDNGDITKELEYQRVRMNRALGIKGTPVNVISKTMSEQISDDVKALMNTHKVGARTIDEHKRKNVGGNKFGKFLK